MGEIGKPDFMEEIRILAARKKWIKVKKAKRQEIFRIAYGL